MRAGDLDRRVTVQELIETQDEFGQPIQSWETVATVWAQVQQQSGREFFAAQQTVSERRTVFRLRWLEGITVTHRVVYPAVADGSPPPEPDGNAIYNINEVRELGRREGLELHSTAAG